MVLLSHTGGRKLPNSKNTNRTMTTHATRYKLRGGTRRNIKIREGENPLFVVRKIWGGDSLKINRLQLKGIVGIGLVNVAAITAEAFLIYGSWFSLPVTVAAVIGGLITTAVCVYFMLEILKM